MNRVEHFNRIALELCNLYEAKDKCYNNSFGDTYKKLGLISAVTRISDKFNRLCNLATNPDIDNLVKSLEDTLRDMASYCIMTVMELENAKPIGLDMQGNIIKRGDVVFPNLNKQIRKGDVFECIEHVVMDDGSVAYIKGKTYASEKDHSITDEKYNENHYWNIMENDEDNWWHYFKRM